MRVDVVPRCHHVLPHGWYVFGPDYWTVPLMLTPWTWMLGPGVTGPVMERVPRHWFRVDAGERVVHRLLGVDLFGRLLDRSGWNRRFAEPMPGFDGTRAGLRTLEESVRGAAGAHGTSFSVHALAAAVALFTGHAWGALWILLPGVALHLHPVLLQRAIMLRLQPTLDRLASCD